MTMILGRRELLRKMAASGAAGAALLSGRMAVAQDGVVTWNDSIPASLDPHLVVSVSGQFAQLNVYDSLFRYAGNPAEFVPWLARSHTVSDDGLVWTIALRDDVKFHSGAKMTVEDVVYSFRRMLSLGAGYGNMFSSVLKPERVEAVGANGVRFTLEHSYAPFLSSLPVAVILDSARVKANEKNGDWGKAFLASDTAGSGAFRFVSGTFRSFEAFDLEAFDDHFAGARPKGIRKARVRFIKEPSTELLALLKGEIDATISYIGPEQAAQIEKNANTFVARDEGLRTFVVRVHNQRPPLDNVHVRRALSYAFNYDGVIKGILKDNAKRINQPLPTNIWGNNPKITGYTYDLAKAKQELEKAASTGVRDLNREIKIFTDHARQDPVLIAQIMQSDMRKLGLKTLLVPSMFDQTTAVTSRVETSPDIWMHHTSAYSADPDNWIGQMYDSSFHGTWKASNWYKNAKVDEMLGKARQIADQDQRSAIYQAAAEQIVDDAADIWVYNPIQLRGLNRRIKNFSFCPIGSGCELRTIEIA